MIQEAESGHNFGKLVPVMFFRDLGEAGYYQELLEEYEIPVEIDEDHIDPSDETGTGNRVALLVAEEHLAEAEDILEQYCDLDEALRLVLGEDDDEPGEFEGLEEIDPDASGYDEEEDNKLEL